MTTYFESAEGITITKDRALIELDRHGVPVTELAAFFEDCGDRPEYEAAAVLAWLGY